MAAKMCNVCGTRRVGSGGKQYDVQSAAAIGLCGPCDTEGGWENTHSDSSHDAIQDEIKQATAEGVDPAEVLTKEALREISGCWICHPELNMAQAKAEPKAKREGHHSPRRKQLNHRTQCKHEQTPAARRACREAHWAEQAEAKPTKPAKAAKAK